MRKEEMALKVIGFRYKELKDLLNADAKEMLGFGCKYKLAYYYDQERAEIFRDVIADENSYMPMESYTYLGTLDFGYGMTDYYDPEDPDQVEEMFLNYSPDLTLENWEAYWEEEVKREW